MKHAANGGYLCHEQSSVAPGHFTRASATLARGDWRADPPENPNVLMFYYRPLGGESGAVKSLLHPDARTRIVAVSKMAVSKMMS
jgi:hypothetical protein